MELSDWSLEWNLPGPELENETFSKKKPASLAQQMTNAAQAFSLGIGRPGP
jgi:hypothetical protein